MKKYLALVLVLLLAALCCGAGAETESGGFTYTVLEDGTASITGCSLSGDIVIPAKIDGYTVTNLARQLFYGTYGPTSLTIPATVTYFGESASDNMWDYVFSYCWSLTAIHVDSANPTFCSVDGVLYSKDKTMLINYPCSRPGETFHVPYGVDYLCCTSFASCENLKKLFLDWNETWWFTYTFYNTGDLTVYYLPGSYTETKVNQDISNGFTHDQDESRCTFRVFGENKLILPEDLTVIETEAFARTDCEYVVVPDGCTAIESRAFADCSNLYYVSLPRSVIRIAEDAFAGCGPVTVEHRK